MKKPIALTVVLLLLVSLLASCAGHGAGGTTGTTTAAGTTAPSGDDKAEGFDYYGNDVSAYCTVPRELYTGLSISPDVTEQDVTDYIENTLLPNNPTEVRVTDRAIKTGDTVYIYYTGYFDGVAFSGGSNRTSAEPSPLVIGSGQFISGFESNLIGVIPSETSEENPARVEATFPVPYQSKPEYAGKTAIFEVEVVYISEFIPSVFSEAFVTETLGFETEETDVIAAFRANLRAQMRKQVEENLSEYLQRAWMEQLVTAATYTAYPEGELDYYRQAYLGEIEYYYNNYNNYYLMYTGRNYYDSIDQAGCEYFGLPDGSDWRSAVDDAAELSVKQNLLIYAIAQNEGYTISEQMFQDKAAEIAEKYQMTAEDLIKEAGAAYVRNSLTLAYVNELVLAAASVDYGELSHTEE